MFVYLNSVGIETAGKAWRSVAKRDDSLQKRGASSGASNAFEQAREVIISGRGSLLIITNGCGLCCLLIKLLY